MDQYSKMNSKENISQFSCSRVNSAELSIQVLMKLDFYEMQIDSYIEMRDKEYAVLANKIDQAESQVLQKKEDLHSVLSKKLEDFKLYQKSIEEVHSEETKRKNDFERQVQASIDSKFSELKSEFTRHRLQGKEIYTNYESEFDGLFNELHSNVNSLKESKVELDDSMKEKFNEFFTYLESQFTAEVRTREENESSTYDLFKTIMKNISDHLEQEQLSRQKNVSMILNLLDDTCQKLEKATSDSHFN